MEAAAAVGVEADAKANAAEAAEAVEAQAEAVEAEADANAEHEKRSCCGEARKMVSVLSSLCVLVGPTPFSCITEPYYIRGFFAHGGWR